MNVASLPLCKELYELSRWEGDGLGIYEDANGKPLNVSDEGFGLLRCYKGRYYSLGYLLRKLPGSITGKSGHYAIHLQLDNSTDLWIASYGGTGSMRQALKRGRQPEDAVTKLAIELFKQGILTK